MLQLLLIAGPVASPSFASPQSVLAAYLAVNLLHSISYHIITSSVPRQFSLHQSACAALYDPAADVSPRTLLAQDFPEHFAVRLTDSCVDSHLWPPIGRTVVKMTVINHIMVEMVNVLARSVDATQTLTSTPTPTPTPSSMASTASSVDPAASTAAGSSSNPGNTTTQSPLLFFVALGFGVVFTNLWYAFNGHCPPTLPLTNV